MSAPSDGARADARKRLAAEVVAPDEQIVAALNDLIVDDPMWIGDDGEPLDYLPEREALIGDFLYAAATALAGVIAEAKAEALEHAADLMRTRIRVQAGSVFASEVVAVVDRLAQEARKRSGR